MTCNQLGGACDHQFHADTFEKIAQMSKQHGIEMAQNSDSAHLEAMEKMKGLMNDPKAMQQWMDKKHKQFDSLPEDN